MLERRDGLGQDGLRETSHPRSRPQEQPTYHAVLVLLRSVVHSRVPRIGPASIYLSRVQLPVPEGGEGVLGTGSAPQTSPDACSVQGPEPGAEATGARQVQGGPHSRQPNSVTCPPPCGSWGGHELTQWGREGLPGGDTRVQCEGGRISQAQNGSEYSREREQFEQRKRHRTVQCVPEIKKLGTAGGFRGKNGVRDVGR